MKSIIELARKAGIDRERPYLAVEYREPWNSCTDAELESLVALVLEEAAGVIEDWDTDSLDPREGAAAIRALAKEKT
jgi:hypothetical protein